MTTKASLGHRLLPLIAAGALLAGSMSEAAAQAAPNCPQACARSMSACRSRRPTSCTPRPTSPRRSASSPSAASTPTSCSSRAASRRPRPSPPRRARRSSASATSRSAAASRCSRSGASRRACRRPTWCRTTIKTAADLKGKRLSATGGGVGGFNWRMGREVLKSAKLDVDDAQFISSATAGRLPGLIAGQIDGVALHPEDVYPRPASRSRALQSAGAARRADAATTCSMPTARRPTGSRATATLLRDTIAAMIEANRTIYRDKDKVVPIIVEATQKPKDAVEYAIDVLTKNCVLVGQRGLRPEAHRNGRSTTTYRHGDIEAAQETERRAGRRRQARQRGGGTRRRPRHHRQLQGLSHDRPVTPPPGAVAWARCARASTRRCRSPTCATRRFIATPSTSSSRPRNTRAATRRCARRCASTSSTP